jgi:hypothetical protein
LFLLLLYYAVKIWACKQEISSKMNVTPGEMLFYILDGLENHPFKTGLTSADSVRGCPHGWTVYYAQGWKTHIFKDLGNPKS